MALDGLYGTDVPLRNCSLTHSLTVYMSADHFVLQCFDTVGWAISPVKIVPEMSCCVLGGTLNLTHTLTHSLTH